MKLATSGAVKVAFGIIAGIGGIALVVLSPTQNVHATITNPSACACSTTTSIESTKLLNCQCGALQCVVAVGARSELPTSGDPVIACLK